MNSRKDKEIIVGKTGNIPFARNREFPFFVKDIKQLCFNPYKDFEYQYSVLIKTALSDKTESLFINKEQYDYLQDKLGASDDE